jgi:hypothetical protein
MIEPIDLHGLKTYELIARPSKVFYEDLGRPLEAGATVGDWLDSLPRQLARQRPPHSPRSFVPRPPR